MKRQIIVSPQRFVSWYQLLASDVSRLETIVREAEKLCLLCNVDCRASEKGDSYPVKKVRDGVFSVTVPCPITRVDQIAAMQEPAFRNNRQQAHVAGSSTYWRRGPIREFYVQTDREIPAPYVPEPAKPVDNIKVIVEVPAENEALIKSIAEDLRKAKGDL